VKLGVEYCKDLIAVLVRMRITEQWLCIDNVGPMNVLEGEPTTPPGCKVMRYEDTGLCRD
jgi:hypothetical protein